MIRRKGFFERLALSLFMLFAAVQLAGCASRGGPVPYEPSDFDRPDREGLAISKTRLIGPLDKLQIKVFQVENLSGDFVVDPSGTIAFPLIGSVEAQGQTTDQLAAIIADRLGQRYLKSPNVQVGFVEVQEQTITVEGAVRQPGVYPIKGQTSLLKAVALARGTSEDANPSRVVVFRTVRGKRMAAAFDLKSIRRAEMSDPELFGNDIVVVDGTQSRSIFRDIISVIPILGLFRPI